MTRSGAPEILELIASHAAQFPDDVAVAHLRVGRAPRESTWSELFRACRASREAFVSTPATSDLVPAYVGKSIESIAMMVGAIASGRIYAGISPKFRLPQLLHVLEACASQTALVDTTGLPVVRDGLRSAERLRNTTWWWLDPPAMSPLSRTAAEAIRTDASLHEFDQVLQSLTTVSDRTDVALDPDRAAVCLFTSGSTGVPKGVLVGWSDLYRRAVAECELFELSRNDRLLSLLPFSFDVGLNQLLTSLVSGARLIILDSWMPTDILNAIATQGITGVSGVPSIWLSLLQGQKALDRAGPHASLRYLTVSGGDMTLEQLRRFAASAPGVGIYKTYGQTESFRSAALRPEEFAERPASVGRPFATARVYIVRADGTRADAGERGEVVHTGLGVMLGYLQGSSSDEKRRPNPFFGADDPSAFAIFTGDQGHLDEQGYLFLAGRRDDMVKVAGNRVHLAELAAQMTCIPGVFAAEAVSVPMAGCDPLLAVFVLPDSSNPGLTSHRLSIEAARRLPSYMLPKLIEIRTDFPLTSSGKPDRQALAAEAARLLQSA